MKEDKVQLKIYISERLDDRFRAMVASKYQRFERGLLSFEAEKALNQYLSSVNTQAQSTQNAVSNKIPSVQNLKQQIRRYLVECGKYDNEYMQHVHYTHLVEAISVLRGSDNRTIKKWIGSLKKFNCIREISGFQWEIL